MAHVTYEVVEHDGGWAYRVDGSMSETFRSHGEAADAAKRAAAEQTLVGETDGIRYQDASGEVHEEISVGDDRPDTDVVDKG